MNAFSARHIVPPALVLAALLAATPAVAEDYTVDTNPYMTTTVLASQDIWDTYELTAVTGQSVRYEVNASAPGCVLLFFALGHNVSGNSQYYTHYSQESCASEYANEFFVETVDGTEFTIVVATTRTDDVEYALRIDVSGAQPPTPAGASPVVAATIAAGMIAGPAALTLLVSLRMSAGARSGPAPWEAPGRPPGALRPPPPPPTD